jgi:hypothetical protein
MLVPTSISPVSPFPLTGYGPICYDPNIPRDRAGSEMPRLAPRARSLSEAAAFPFHAIPRTTRTFVSTSFVASLHLSFP